jgi:drug/metabolite transporter (DMT)-like permease
MERFLGPGLILFSNFAAIATLTVLRFQPSPFSMQLLTFGNLVCGAMLIFPSISGRPVLPTDSKSGLAILLWACCYCVNYILFVLYPSFLSLSDFIIAQSVAPTLAVLISGDWRSENDRLRKLLINCGAITALLFLAILKRDVSRASHFVFLSFMTATACSLGTNFAARSLTGRAGPIWIQARVALLSGCFLSLFVCLTYGAQGLENFGSSFLLGLLTGFAILLVQSSFLFGLKNSAPYLSALLLSSSVPISLFAEAVTGSGSFGAPELVLSAIYCLFAIINRSKPKIELSPCSANVETAR